jgi:hypothetical protein
LSLPHTRPITLASEKKHHPKENVDGRHEQQEENCTMKSETATAWKMNEGDGIEEGERDDTPADDPPEGVTEMGTKRTVGAAERDEHRCRDDEEKEPAKPGEPAEALREKP